jgi:general secretion pathway protein C
MDIYLKKYFWLVPIVVILCCGVLAAKAASHLLEAKVLVGNGAAKRAASKPRPKLDTQKPPPSKDANEVIGRNMFCSTCEPPQTAETPTSPTVVDDNNPPITSLPLALAATIVAQNPASSAATVINTSTQRSGQYSVGDVIPDAGEVRKIRPKFIDFHNRSLGRLERIELGGIPSTQPAYAAVAPPPVAAPTPPVDSGNPDAELLAAVDKGVKKVGDNQYDIDRALVEKILGDPSVMMRQARVVPSIKDGKANGFKMYAIRPSSVYAKIGLQNGDTIQAINGFEMTSMDKAMEIYTKLRSASNLSISVLRRGQQVQMDYSIK